MGKDKKPPSSPQPSPESALSNELSRTKEDLDREKSESSQLQKDFHQLVAEADQLRAQLQSGKVPEPQRPQASDLLSQVMGTVNSFVPILGPLLGLL